MPDMKSLLFMSLFLMCAGTLSGWAVVDTLAGRSAGVSFLRFGSIIFFLVCAMQVCLFVMARTRLFYQLIFSSSLLVSLTWMMMCLVFPIYWMPAIGAHVKAVMLVFVVWLFVCNFYRGTQEFKAKWGEKKPVIKKYYSAGQSSLDWDKLIKSLHLSVSVYIPGVPQQILPFLSVLLILLMILGLSFRRVYTTASVFAWGIPCIIISSGFIQMISIGVAQALKLAEIEEEVGAQIRSKVH